MLIPVAQLYTQYQRLMSGAPVPLTIAAADMTLGVFQAIPWQNLTFIDCDFRGSNVNLTALQNCTFTNCTFHSVVYDLGVVTNTTFINCKTVGRSILVGADASKGLVFERCDFSGGGSMAPKDFKGIGCTGETTFRHCTGNADVLVAGTRLILEGCKFHNMTFAIGRQFRRGSRLTATTKIDNSHGTGIWRMVGSRMDMGHFHNSSVEQIVHDDSEFEV